MVIPYPMNINTDNETAAKSKACEEKISYKPFSFIYKKFSDKIYSITKKVSITECTDCCLADSLAVWRGVSVANTCSFL